MSYENILLIDDDADDQEIFMGALEIAANAVRCTAMSSAREALQQLVECTIAADVIFLDLNMPVMSGQQFLAEFQKQETLKHIPVFVLSTSSDSKTIQQTKELGARDFITKPATFDDLIVILKALIG